MCYNTYIKSFLTPIALTITLLLMAGCEDNRAPAALPYAGQSIMVIAPKLRAGLISGPIVEEARKFGAQTGARIRVVTPGWHETIENIQQSFQDPKLHYDVYVITTSWSGPLFANGAIAEIPAWVKQKVEFDDILPIYAKNTLTWKGKVYALPYDGDTVTLYYRKDLFANPAYQKRFFEHYGYPLQAPTTWESFQDIGEFFNGWDWDEDGEIEYGLVGSRMKNSSAMLIFLTRAAAYAKHPDDPAYHFDPATMRPRINNPAFVETLEAFTASLQLGPPGMVNFTGSEVRTAFIKGRAAMAIDWANIGIDAAGSPVSVIKGKVGYAPLPGSTRVYNANTAQWEDRPNYPASLVGNYLFLVNKNAKNLQLALEFAAHMTSKAMTGKLTTTAGTGVNPSRHSHLEQAEAWTAHGMDRESAQGYLEMLRAALAHDNYIVDIRIPGSARYYKALDEALHAALTGKLTAQAALDKAAAEWEAITDSLDRARQIRLYQESLSLP